MHRTSRWDCDNTMVALQTSQWDTATFLRYPIFVNILIFSFRFHFFRNQLNREIAQSVYNKSSADAADSDSTQPLRIDTKKDLLYKIHIKNKYIKRLLCEYGALKDENERLKEQVLMLNVNLKQAAHKLTEAIIESMEQKRQHHLSTDDIVSLHTKIIDVRQEMARIETDKQQFKRDILNLGDEIQRKIDQWNEKLKKKYSNMRKTSSLSSVSDDVDGMANSSNDVNKQKVTDAANDERLEVNLLSQAVHKRNVIISEMEMLLTELTMEISNSAIVINRVIKNLSNRENNVATNLEKLQHHLSKFLSRPVVHIETQTPSRMTGKHCVWSYFTPSTFLRDNSQLHIQLTNFD